MKALTYTLMTADHNIIELSNKRLKEKIHITTGIISRAWQYKVTMADKTDSPWDKIRIKDMAGTTVENTAHISFQLEEGKKFKIDFLKKGVSIEERINYLRQAHATGSFLRCSHS